MYAPVDLILSEENTVIPDLLYLSSENIDIVKEKKVQGVPNLIIEITSTNRKTDLEEKSSLYQAFGVSKYVIVDTQEKQI